MSALDVAPPPLIVVGDRPGRPEGHASTGAVAVPGAGSGSSAPAQLHVWEPWEVVDSVGTDEELVERVCSACQTVELVAAECLGLRLVTAEPCAGASSERQRRDGGENHGREGRAGAA